jgi:hypothetical protein
MNDLATVRSYIEASAIHMGADAPRRARLALSRLEEMGTVEVLVQASIDGSEPLEATTRLPVIPPIGGQLCVWVADDGAYGRREEYLKVVDVALCTYAPERIVVTVGTDGFGTHALLRVFKAMDENEQP